MVLKCHFNVSFYFCFTLNVQLYKNMVIVKMRVYSNPEQIHLIVNA